LVDGGEAACYHRSCIVVRVKFEDFWLQVHRPQGAEEVRDVQGRRVPWCRRRELGAQISCMAWMKGCLKSIGVRVRSQGAGFNGDAHHV
jgi:hypothetical protein